MNWIPVIINLAEKRFHAWPGLAFSLTLALSAGYGAALIFSSPLVSITDSLFDRPPSPFYSYITLTYYTLIVVAVFGFWKIRRRIPRFKQNKIGVLFSSINPEELANEVSQLRSRVVEELKRLDMLDLIDIRDLPANQRITQARDALSAINIAEGTLLIWGHFRTGQRGNQKHAGFPTINFTYRHPSNVSIHFHNEIGESLSQRKWTYGDGNDFVETSVVASNIAQVALFIIGLTLLAWQDKVSCSP